MERILESMWTFIITLHFFNRCLLSASTVMGLGMIHMIVPHITKREMTVLSNSNLSKAVQTCAFQRQRKNVLPTLLRIWVWSADSNSCSTEAWASPAPAAFRLSSVASSVTGDTICDLPEEDSMSIDGLFFFFLAMLCGFWNLSSPTRDWTQVLGSNNMNGDLTTGLPRNSPQGLF